MKSSHAQLSPEEKLAGLEPLIIANDKKTFIKHSGEREPAKLLRQVFMQHWRLSVIDAESLKMIQVLQLHKAIDRTGSLTGSAMLLRSLIQPGTDLQYIRSKQESLREIAANDTLRQALEDFVREYSQGEDTLYRFFNKGLNALFPYVDFRKTKAAVINLTRSMQNIPGAVTPYLSGLLSNLQAYRGSAIDQMMNGSLYKTFSGLKSDKEVGFFTPKLKFIPRRFTKWVLVGPVVAVTPYILSKVGLEQLIPPFMSTIGFVWTGLHVLYSLLIKSVKDTDSFIEPFREKCVYDKTFSRAIDSVGMLDELLACHEFARKSQHAAILPEVTDKDHHAFEATGLKNPVIAKENPDFVPNTVQMQGVKLTFISGPNSGGKTTICKSIVHNQLLAQMGSYILAEKASINIADMISYQAPQFDELQDNEGRFGTELSRTRDIFYATSPKSLVILDELAEGTTYEERLQESFGILSDFHTIGNNTVLVTHNHSLVDRFMDEQKGQCVMVEFKGDNPTFRVIPGISRVSHAARVAKRINFSGEERRRYMKENGYL